MLSELETRHLTNRLSEFSEGELFAPVSKASIRGRHFSITKRQGVYYPAEQRMSDFNEPNFSGLNKSGTFGGKQDSYPTFGEALAVIIKLIEITPVESDKEQELLDEKWRFAELNRLLGLLVLWQHKKIKESEGAGLFEGKTDGAGRALEKPVRDSLMSYINVPSLEAWVGIADISITPSSTIISEYLGLFSKAPSDLTQYNENNLPSSDAIRKVLVLAVARHNYRCEEKLSEIQLAIHRIEHAVGE